MSALPDLPPVDLADRALRAAGLSVTISDAQAPDNPLVWVNPAFEHCTGYGAQESLGRNCRFLQGADSDRATVARLADAVRAGQPIAATLLNYRKDGTAFWNDVSIRPIHDDAGQLTHFVGVQSDVTDRVVAQEQQQHHLTAERASRSDAEAANAGLALLAEATSMLAATLDVGESLDRLTELIVPLMADWCVAELVEEGAVRQISVRHRDDSAAPLMHRLAELRPGDLHRDSPRNQVLRDGRPLLFHGTPEPMIAAASPELSEIYRQLGLCSALIVPMTVRRQVLGVLTMVQAESGRCYGASDLRVAADLGRRAALTVDNAALFTREHEVAEKLQRSLLPDLPDLPGLQTAARYLPSETDAKVGGDWYDVLGLPDGAVGLAIGDVMGHDLKAAVAMGQLRSVLRSYAWRGLRPAVVLDSLDELVQGLDMAQLATALYGRLEFPPGIRPQFCYANAGHLPPLVLDPGGTVRFLHGGRSLLVGAPPEGPRVEDTASLRPGSTIVLYTDGLVEHRGLDIDVGTQRLGQVVAEHADASPDDLCDAILSEAVSNGRDDDVALLVVRIDG